MKTLNIDFTPCRWYYEGKIWISYDGEVAASQPYYKGYPKKLPIEQDELGKYVINSSFLNMRVDIALAVIVCFCPPPPQDGQKYMINFKDGDKYNCHKNNLEWIPSCPTPLTQEGVGGCLDQSPSKPEE